MTVKKILVADNDTHFQSSIRDFLTFQGYHVLTSSNPEQTRGCIKNNRDLDVIILDVRLENDKDDNDYSGVSIALNEARRIPKIIITKYKDYEKLRDMIRYQPDGLPTMVEYIDKEDDNLLECLSSAVQRAGPQGDRMREIYQALNKADRILDGYDRDAREQSRQNFTIARAFAIAGGLFLLSMIPLAYLNFINASMITAIPGVVTSFIGYLFFNREKRANERVDRYRQERIAVKHFEILLNSCETIPTEQDRGDCLKKLILAVQRDWTKSGQVDRQAAGEE